MYRVYVMMLLVRWVPHLSCFPVFPATAPLPLRQPATHDCHRALLQHRHLKTHPENDFAPLFDFFEPWCHDENRFGDSLNMLTRCWPALRRGLRGWLLSRFFLWRVFLTHSLTVCERGEFYQLLGMEPAFFDAEVMRQTNHIARRAFPWVFRLNDDYLRLRDQLVDVYRSLRQEGRPLKALA